MPERVTNPRGASESLKCPNEHVETARCVVLSHPPQDITEDIMSLRDDAIESIARSFSCGCRSSNSTNSFPSPLPLLRQRASERSESLTVRCVLCGDISNVTIIY